MIRANAVDGTRGWFVYVGALVLLVFLSTLPGVSMADNKKEAREKYKEGVELFKDDNFEEALEAFVASYELYPHPDTLVNIANCHAELYNFPKAYQYFELYLEEKGDDIEPEQKEEIETKMERVGKKVGRLFVKPADAKGTLWVDGDKIGDLPMKKPVYLEAGLHEVEVKKDGEVVFEDQVDIEGKKDTDLDISQWETEDGDEDDDEDDDEDEDEDDEGATKPKKKKKGALRVEVEGEEIATVEVDGEEMGKTPWEDQFKEGQYQVSVTAPDKPEWLGNVPVQSAKHTILTVDLDATKKVPDVNNPMFWIGIGAAVPSLVTGIVMAALSSSNNSRANDLYDALTATPPLYTGDAFIRKTQKQNDLVDLADAEKKAAIGLLAGGGVFVVAAVVSLFIFRKEKPAASGTFEISGVEPFFQLETGSGGLGLSGTF